VLAGKTSKSGFSVKNVQAACVSATGLKYAAVCVRPVAKNIYEYASRGIVCGYIIISLYLGVCFCICISNIPSWHTKIHGERRKCCAASACCACRLCTEKIYISRIADRQCAWNGIGIVSGSGIGNGYGMGWVGGPIS